MDGQIGRWEDGWLASWMDGWKGGREGGREDGVCEQMVGLTD